jgi:hypothetical protein
MSNSIYFYVNWMIFCASLGTPIFITNPSSAPQQCLRPAVNVQRNVKKSFPLYPVLTNIVCFLPNNLLYRRKYKFLLGCCAVRWQQAGDTAAALGLGVVGIERGGPAEAEGCCTSARGVKKNTTRGAWASVKRVRKTWQGEKEAKTIFFMVFN